MMSFQVLGAWLKWLDDDTWTAADANAYLASMHSAVKIGFVLRQAKKGLYQYGIQ